MEEEEATEEGMKVDTGGMRTRAVYQALTTFRLVVLDKRSGVRLVVIGKTLLLSLDKLFMTEAGYQAKTACGNLQLCVGLEADVE